MKGSFNSLCTSQRERMGKRDRERRERRRRKEKKEEREERRERRKRKEKKERKEKEEKRTLLRTAAVDFGRSNDTDQKWIFYEREKSFSIHFHTTFFLFRACLFFWVFS